MKKLAFLITAFISIAQFSSAQTASEVLTKDIPVTFFGVDFTIAKGIQLNAYSTEIVQKYMPAINQLLIKEPEKFHFAKTLNKTNFTYSFEDVNRFNALIDTNKFQVSEATKVEPISNETIASMIKQYTLTGKTGTGLVFIVRSMNKTKLQATYNMVFFTLPEGNIILNEVVAGKAGGFGFRNFWTNPLYDILKYDIKRIIKNYSK